MKHNLTLLLTTSVCLLLCLAQKSFSMDLAGTSVRIQQNALSKTFGGAYNPEMHPLMQDGLIGKLSSGNTLSLTGSFLSVSKDPGDEICSARMYYRVQQGCETGGAFSSVDLSFANIFGTENWSYLGSVDLLAGLDPGFYTVQVYWEVVYQNIAGGVCNLVLTDDRGGLYHTGFFEYDITDSFSDGNFSTSPGWTGNTANWLVTPQASSGPDFSGNKTNTVRLNAPSVGGSRYLATTLSPMRDAQDWSFILGRRDIGYTGSTPVHIWLFGNLSNLLSPNIDGYRLKIGDNSGGDEIILERVTNNVGVTILSSASSIPNNLTDISITVRVTRSATGDWELYTSPLPAANGGGVNFWSCPRTESTVFQGAVTDNTYIPAAYGYFGLVAKHTSASNTRTVVEFDQFSFVSEWDMIPGCTDANALNFDPEADTDDGSCVVPDCPTPSAALAHCYAASENTVWTYRSQDVGDRVTIYFNSGEFQSCCDYVAVHDGPTTASPMIYQGTGNVTDAVVQSTQEFLTVRIFSNATNSCSDGLYLPLDADIYCGELYIPGCTFSDACNYNEHATTDDGSCDYSCYGCTDESAVNYSASAIIEDGSCTYTSSRIIISEIHYSPCSELGGNDADFIELYNPRSLPLTMTDWRLFGLDYAFPTGFTMLPFEYIVIARDIDYYSYLTCRVFKAELSDNDLAGSGEEIKITNASGYVMDYVVYGASLPWPEEANGTCASLEVMDIDAGNYYPANWQSSLVDGGTPGESNSSAFACTVCGTEGYDESVVLEENAESGLSAWATSPAGSWVASAPAISGSAGLNHVNQGGNISRAVTEFEYLHLEENCVSWQFQVALGSWDPDNDDKFMIYLVSDQADLSDHSLNGYAIGVNFGDSNDQLSLYRITNGAPVSTIMSGKLDLEPDALLGIEVVKDNNGYWMLRYDMDGGFDRLFNVQAQPVSDVTHSGGEFFGIALHHTPGGAEEAFVVDDINIDLCGSAATWYSVISGNSADAIWSRNPNAVIGQVALFNAETDIVIQSGHTVIANNNIVSNDFTIEAGATLDGGNTSIKLSFAGNLINDGSFLPGDASLNAFGSEYQVIGGLSSLSFHQLSINNPTEVRVETPVEILYLLEPFSGVFATNNQVTLAGNETYTGYVGPVGTGADVAGNLNYQLYLYASTLAQGWANIGAPCEGLTVADLDDDIITTGFPVAEYPLTNFNNVLTYDESVPGAWEEGYVGATSTSEALSTEKAYFLYEFGDALTIDAAGPLRKGDITIPLHYTNTGNPDADGYNFVYNIYPAPIDLDALAEASFPVASGDPNVSYYFWDGLQQTYILYQSFTGIGDASRYAAPFQPFFIQVAENTGLSFSEEIKAVDQAGLSILRNAASIPIIEFSAGTESKRDKAYLRLSEESVEAVDAADARKLIAPMGNTLQMALTNSLGNRFSIDSRPFGNDEIVAGIYIDAETGDYTLRVEDVSSFPQGWCLQLIDLHSNESIPVENGMELAFSFDQPFRGERFLINATPIVQTEVTNAICAASPSGKIEAAVSLTGSYNYRWFNESNNLLSSGSSDAAVLLLENLLPGTYYLVIDSDFISCREVTVSAVVEGETITIPLVEYAVDNCNNSGNGKILLNSGGLDLTWQVACAEIGFVANGTGNIHLENLNAGKYNVEISGACHQEIVQVSLMDELAIDPEITYSASADPRGTRVAFNCAGNQSDRYFWRFANGETSYSQRPDVLFSDDLNSITASLAISNGTCTEDIDLIILKDQMLETASASYQVENGSNSISIIRSIPFVNGSVAEVYDLKGSVVFSTRLSDTHRLDIPTTTMTNGVYIFNLTLNNEIIHSFKFNR